MRPKPSQCPPMALSGTDLDAVRLLQKDCVMRHFPHSPQATQAGRAEMTSRLCAQQALNDILQTIREQAGWPARDPDDKHDECDDAVACPCPSLVQD